MSASQMLTFSPMLPPLQKSECFPIFSLPKPGISFQLSSSKRNCFFFLISSARYSSTIERTSFSPFSSSILLLLRLFIDIVFKLSKLDFFVLLSRRIRHIKKPMTLFLHCSFLFHPRQFEMLWFRNPAILPKLSSQIQRFTI